MAAARATVVAASLGGRCAAKVYLLATGLCMEATPERPGKPIVLVL